MAIGGMLLLIPLVLITGSRAGLLTLVLSICVTAALISLVSSAAAKRRRRRPPAFARVAPMAMGVVVATGLLLVTIGLGRDRAFERLIGTDPIATLRADLLPVTWNITIRNFPWGTGIGSFDDVYRMYEPGTLLMPQYVNHAHSDLLEIIMTGGMIGGLIMAFAVALFVIRSWSIAQGGLTQIRANIWPAAALIALTVLFIASIVDYPLRTPAMASYAVLLAIWASSARNPTIS